jgi:hypothetical protein
MYPPPHMTQLLSYRYKTLSDRYVLLIHGRNTLATPILQRYKTLSDRYVLLTLLLPYRYTLLCSVYRMCSLCPIDMCYSRYCCLIDIRYCVLYIECVLYVL